ncbi:MAG: fumarylacetoacetate hydrolase family protein [Pseudomonadales bacterium]
MDSEKINALGDELYEAMRSFSTLAPLTDREADITIEDAYHISLRMLQRRIDTDGERVVGKKIGVTSAAVQEMLGVFQPDFGFLTNAMQYDNGADIPVAGNLIQPRAEAEIAFVLKHDLGSNNIDEQAVLDATECIVPCFEIVDSRIQDWNIKIQDTVADNASCGVFVLGDNRVDPNDFDLPNLKITVSKNGKPLSEGLASAVQGNPLTAVAWLANTLGRYDIPFVAGDIILSGSLVPLEPVSAGDYLSLELSGIGSASVKFV